MAKRTTVGRTPPHLQGMSPAVVTLARDLRGSGTRSLATLELPGRHVEVVSNDSALWVVVRRPSRGGLAMRAVSCETGCKESRAMRTRAGEAARFAVESAAASYRVGIRLDEGAIPTLRVTTTITPRVPLLIPFLPRDLYPLDEEDNPRGARGNVEAAQRGLNSGIVYFRQTGPAFGSTLYFQNFTELNPYFEATGTTPDSSVGGIWPEIGFLLPTPSLTGTPPARPIPAGRETVISDALLAFHDEPGGDEREMARRFLSLLGAVLRRIDLPPTEHRDWVSRAERSIRDLSSSPKATVRHYGNVFVHPYTDAEYPDSMVQLSVLTSLRDYEAWAKRTIPLRATLAEGVSRFYDPKLRTLRRYLPNVGKDKNRHEVDSWYMYHPLSQLGRLALDDDARARRLFLKALDYSIAAAHRFDYKWPIKFDLRDFRVITESRDDEGRGQTDVGGMYAYVMLQAFELTKEQRYLDEARAAIDAARGMRFELNYQANLTAWGAAACARLWRITDDEIYLRQSYVYLASFFHNTVMWESEINNAKHYRTFLGVTALHDAPYMALYECFDSFAAFERFLKDSGPDLDPAARFLVSAYCRYCLDRAWYYYPDALPADVIADEQRENNGHVDRKLCFPLEDLYVDGRAAGEVGQEIYGAGAAFVLASRMYHPVEGASFRIFCDHFILASERPRETALSFQLAGAEGTEAQVSIERMGRAKVPVLEVSVLDGRRVRPRSVRPDRTDYSVPADSRVTIAW